MEENGARLNRQRLTDAHLLAHTLATRPGPESQSQSQIRPRAGAIQDTVIRVLAEAGRPLRAREIHAAAQKLAGAPLSWNTVKDCLHKHAGRPDGPIERVSHGRYRHGYECLLGVADRSLRKELGADGHRVPGPLLTALDYGHPVGSNSSNSVIDSSSLASQP